LWEYHFASSETRKKTGVWWVRTDEGLWFPPVSLQTHGFRQILIDQGWL
jgi:hypothetical protein